MNTTHEFSANDIKLLHEAGIRPDTHHMTVKSVTNQFLGFTPDKNQIAQIRQRIETAIEEGFETPDLPSLATLKQNGGSEWGKVIEVTEWGSTAAPVRVRIQCQDEQFTSDDVSVCEGTREIFTQDLFQVYRCVPCQKRAVQIARNIMARARRARRKEAGVGA